jgi:restriction system protein
LAFTIIAWQKRNEPLPEPPIQKPTTNAFSGAFRQDSSALQQGISRAATLREIDWYQFEKLVARLLSHEGYEVTRSGGAKADGGVDLVAEKAGAKVIVQCKHWQNWKVKEGTIREMIGTLKLHGGNRLSLYTLNPSTNPAGQLARDQSIEIITENQILARMGAIGMDRFADLLDPANKHCPICDEPMVLRTGGFKPFWGCSRYPKCRGKIEGS